MKIKIEIPATSANLGPGFDTLGLAVDWQYQFEISTSLKEKKSNPKLNMVKDGFNAVYDAIKLQEKPHLEVGFSDNILIGKGLGTSAACYLAGIEAANQFLNNPLSEEEKIDIAVKVEGHADNIMPAYYGGLQIITKKEQKNKNDNMDFINLRLKIDKKIKLILLVPSFSMPTKKTRKMLDKDITLDSAVYNISRAMLLTHALVLGKYELLQEATLDKLHQPIRSKNFPKMYEIFDAAIKQGAHGVYLSGGGPTIAAFATKNEKDICKAMQNKIKDPKSIVKICHVVDEGLKII
tara:strand:- start:43 stop:924 length:882 start_codon:yes stop_codon:yes gene_type:complete